MNYLIYYILCGRGRQTNSGRKFKFLIKEIFFLKELLLPRLLLIFFTEGSPQQFILLNRTSTQLSQIQANTRKHIYQNNSRNSRNSQHSIGNDEVPEEISIINQDGSINEGMILKNGGQLPYQ